MTGRSEKQIKEWIKAKSKLTKARSTQTARRPEGGGRKIQYPELDLYFQRVFKEFLILLNWTFKDFLFIFK